ncbi:MAG: thiamine-phosphate kinase [Parvularculaceae bacterium]|nr:thiamine-phosphate kinase [Parvularculaceae bacterium]
MSGEFDIIARYFAPLSSGFAGAFALGDDAASLDATDIVITKDVLVEGVHFRARDPRRDVAMKALRVNLSDLAAKGARPIGYFLGCVWPQNVKEDAIAEFAAGLGEDQDAYKISLMGGDTTVHGQKGGLLVVSVTMIGARGSAGMIRRSSARPGDDVYVSGTIGDACLGFGVSKSEIRVAPAHKAFLAGRYLLPSPRVALGGALAGHASAAIDVSDGLLADAGHIAKQSKVAIEIIADKIPLSEAALTWLDRQDRNEGLARLAGGGDDYEILFTAPAARRRSIEMASQVTKTPIARIGTVSKGAGVQFLDAQGAAIETGQTGFDHFGRHFGQ